MNRDLAWIAGIGVIGIAALGTGIALIFASHSCAVICYGAARNRIG